jgi:pimeloyl-ACP methyl ester carboxylesterase
MKKVYVVVVMLLVLAAGLFAAQAAAVEDGRYIDFEGVEIYTQAYNYDRKANEAILFLPGLGGSHAHAGFLFHPDNRYMTITLDYLNHGLSGKTSELSWDILIDSVAAVLDGYGVKKVNLVGHSFGADVAMMFAQKYPRRVKDIVLIDRAYYNFSDLEQFNVTRRMTEILEYNPGSGLTFPEFSQYLDLGYGNDISRTWDLKKKVLLISADPSAYQELPELIAMLKMFPEMFGIPPELAAELPDFSDEDAAGIMEFLNEAAVAFAAGSNHFDLVQTPHSHMMILDPTAQDDVRYYVLGYLKNRLSNSR